MRRLALPVLLLTATAAAAAPARLTEAEVRAFVARQESAWNAGDLEAYFRLFTPGARFTDQARAKDGRVVLYGTSTLAEARRQSRKALARSRSHEADAVRALRLAADGRSAQVTAGVTTTLTETGHARRLCAERTMTLVSTQGGLRSNGQTDTLVPCP